MLFEEDFERSLVESGRGGLSNLFHGVEIEFERCVLVAAGSSGDNFAPLGGEFTEFLKLGRGERLSRHAGSYLGVRTQTAVKILPSM